MSRVINPNVPGKERKRLKRSVALALRELMDRSEVDSISRDLLAFIVLALEGIDKTVELTTSAWEKRDYWIKADKFRLEWEWAGRTAKELTVVILEDNWDEIPKIAIKIYQHVEDETISKNHRMGKPWTGAWDEFNQKN